PRTAQRQTCRQLVPEQPSFSVPLPLASPVHLECNTLYHMYRPRALRSGFASITGVEPAGLEPATFSLRKYFDFVWSRPCTALLCVFGGWTALSQRRVSRRRGRLDQMLFAWLGSKIAWYPPVCQKSTGPS